MHGTRAMFVKPGIPKGLILTSEDGATFQRVGLFTFRDPENLPESCKERNDPALIERVRKEKEMFFAGCEPRDISIM
jgi:hypothetical protein